MFDRCKVYVVSMLVIRIIRVVMIKQWDDQDGDVVGWEGGE